MPRADRAAAASGPGPDATSPARKSNAARRPIVGLDEVLRLHAGLARLFAEQPSRLVFQGLINGLPGFVTIEGDGRLQTTALEVDDDRVVGIYVTRNPDKLRHLAFA